MNALLILSNHNTSSLIKLHYTEEDASTINFSESLTNTYSSFDE